MGFFSKAFGKKKATYQSRTYVGTPGGFRHQRSLSDILTVSHPSPADYQVHLDSVEQVTRRREALAYLSEECSEYSEDLYEDGSEDNSDMSSSYKSSVDSGSYYEGKPRYVPAVNYQTAQEQWARLQAHPIRQPKSQAAPIQRAPVYRQPPRPMVRANPVNTHRQQTPKAAQRAPVYYQQPPPQHLPVRPVPQRVSEYARLRGQRSEPCLYQTAPQYMPHRRHHSEREIRPSNTLTAAQYAARSAMGFRMERSYHEKNSDAIRKKAGLPPFPYRMVGGLPVPGAWVE
jgi:hypothetical protein